MCIFSSDKVFIIPFLSKVTLFLKSISLLEIIKNCSKGWWQSYRAVEFYVLLRLFFAVLCFVALAMFPFLILYCPFYIVLLFLAWGLLDIFQAWLGIFILKPSSIYSPPRSLILALINYAEIVIVFAVLVFSFNDSFTPRFYSIWQSLRYSIGIATTLGSIYEPSKLVGYLLFYGEILFILVFVLVVVNRVLSYFRQ